MDLDVSHSLDDILNIVEDISKREIDVSLQISDENSDTYKMQEQLRLSTHSFFSRYIGMIHWGNCFSIDDNKRVFDAFKKARDLFADHPYHHVIEGRIARMVQVALEKNSPIPPELQDDYRFFKFFPWNDPNLNYGNIRDFALGSCFERIPPEYRVSRVTL